MLLAAATPTAGAQYAIPASLSARAVDAAGHSADRFITGEPWAVRGALSPTGRAQRVIVTVRRAGAVLLRREASSRARSGAFSVTVRIRRPGQVVVRVAHPRSRALDSAVATLAVAVRPAGRPRPGCARPTLVTRASERPAARLGSGSPVRRGMLIFAGASISVPDGARLRLQRAGVSYRRLSGLAAVRCGDVQLVRGRAVVTASGPGRPRGAVGLPRGEVFAISAGTKLAATVHETAEVRLRRGRARIVSDRAQSSRIALVDGDVALFDGSGLPRLTTWPFPRSPQERPAGRRDHLPAYWSDGQACSAGCRPSGVKTGWPLKPFHEQHPLRAGLNELRPANMHNGIDIQAPERAEVYAIQSGTARLADVGTVDERVIVGRYEYWHLKHRVHSGQHVRAYRTVLGRLYASARHAHLSETVGGRYLNPLRPRGRVLAPYRDRDRPVVGAVKRGTPGLAFVEAFDPQTVRTTNRYRTPVLAPAAVAWRAHDAAGRVLTPLTFAYRGAQHLPASAANAIYGPGTTPPDHRDRRPGGWACFVRWTTCVPRWNYRITGVPADASALTVYAWDWSGNRSVRTSGLG